MPGDSGGREVDYKETFRGDGNVHYLELSKTRGENIGKERTFKKKKLKEKKLRINKHHPNKPEI